MNMISRNLTAPYGCPAAYIYHVNRFSETVQQCAVEPTGVECLSHNRRGFKLTLCSGENEYEVVLDRDRVKLGLIRMDQQRAPLAEGGAASQAVWERFAQLVRQMEGSE